jgi:hypothetical protein
MTRTETNDNGKEVTQIMDISDITNEMSENLDNIRDGLNTKGIKKYDEFERARLKDVFDDGVYDFQCEVNDKNTEDGLINVWRVITYNKAEINLDDIAKDEYHDILDRGCVGEYWSWDEDAAAPHCGSGGGIDLILHGRVKPEYVDWVSTVYKNIYAFKEESEIEVIPGKEILLYDVTTYVANYSHVRNNTKSVSLGIEPMIVKA